jgi:hypothetical protein
MPRGSSGPEREIGANTARGAPEHRRR